MKLPMLTESERDIFPNQQKTPHHQQEKSAVSSIQSDEEKVTSEVSDKNFYFTHQNRLNRTHIEYRKVTRPALIFLKFEACKT